jgi:dTDP-4-dehydrorhamnose reductase
MSELIIKILITGSQGQLGNEIKDISSKFNYLNFFFTDIDTLDICNKNAVSDFISINKINFIVNCAAYTNVDAAETDIETANKINAEGPKILAEISSNLKIPIIHISTDYVYDNGTQNIPFKETDKTNPVSIYAKSKLDGEKNIALNPNHIIIRTSWLYSVYGKNFVKSILNLSKEKETLNIVFDQTGTPTYAKDLAEVILKIIRNYNLNPQNLFPGIYNYSNEGVCSWYDFAHEINEISKNNCKIFPIETSQYPTPACRPSFSVMNKSKIKNIFNIEIPHWKESLKNFFFNLSNQ